MRFALVAATIVALSLVACNGPQGSDSGTGTEIPLTETHEPTESPPSGTPLTPESTENTLVETPEYTGVIFSETRAPEWGFWFDPASTGFWEPSVDDVTRAEKRIRQFLVAAQDDPDLHFYLKANAPIILEKLEEYRRQYVGIIVDGEKRIWCNFFLHVHEFPDWKRDPVFVLDGGNAFWDIEYVLDKDECINFKVHGEA